MFRRKEKILLFPKGGTWYNTFVCGSGRGPGPKGKGVTAVDRTELLDRTARSPEERQLLARVWDKLEGARRGIPSHTPFLSTAQQEAAERLLNAAGHPRHLFSGGWPDAERKILALLPDWQEEDCWESPLTALRCTWHSGESLTHRDFLGSVLGQGLDREKIGDILIRPGVCDILVFQEVSRYLLQNLTGAGRVKLKVEEIGLEEVEPPLTETKLIHDTVSSLRLDAVMASGFSIGRSRAAELISGGKAEVNHHPCIKTDRQVAQGDVITCRGLGKCVVKEVGGLSKKGRTILTLERYV